MPSQEGNDHRGRAAYSRGAVNVYLVACAQQLSEGRRRTGDAVFQVVGVEVPDRPAAHRQAAS